MKLNQSTRWRLGVAVHQRKDFSARPASCRRDSVVDYLQRRYRQRRTSSGLETKRLILINKLERRRRKFTTSALQCIGMQPFSNSSERLTMPRSHKNFMTISQPVQTNKQPQSDTTENNTTSLCYRCAYGNIAQTQHTCIDAQTASKGVFIATQLNSTQLNSTQLTQLNSVQPISAKQVSRVLFMTS